MIFTKEEILTSIEDSFSSCARFVAAQNENEFTITPGGKWSAGQHLEHLIKTTKPVNMALGMPLILVRWMFGKPNRAERTYDELVKKYKGKLSAGAKAPPIFIPPKISFEQRAQKLDQFLALKEKLKKSIAVLPADKISGYLLPHPLLGKLTLREMLYFTIYHTQHHLAIIKNK